MKAMILAAGLGTRLKELTRHKPKALVTVNDVPMLQRVIERLESEGFTYIVVNTHHFSEQVKDFLKSHTWKAEIRISDETALLRDTGGALTYAAPLLLQDDEPFLIHNVDILSNAPLAKLMETHKTSQADATLLVSDRDSSRKLYFDKDMYLRGWVNLSTGEKRGETGDWPTMLSFSGIHVISASLLRKMVKECPHEVFPIMDYYLSHTRADKLKGYRCDELSLIDIGKPETLSRANNLGL